MLKPELVKVLTSEALPIELEDLKLDLRVDSDDDDPLLERMARGAAGFLERRTGISVIPGEYQALLCEWWCEPLEIYRHPVRELVSIEYLSDATTWTPVDLANFQTSRRGKSFLIKPLSTFEPPDLFTDFDSIRITFLAGFDAEDSTFGDEMFRIEDDVRTMLHMLVGHYYKNRELFEADKLAEVEASAGALLGAHRTFW